MVQAWLTHILGYRKRRPQTQDPLVEPPVSLLIYIDDIYRNKAEQDELPKIAPKHFNPDGKSWLALMHVTKKKWHFTALYSNTPRAIS